MTMMLKANRTIGLLAAALVFVFDQGSKAWVTGPLGLDVQDDSLTLTSFFDLRFVKNVGVSLGLLPASGDVTRWALVVLTGAIAAGVLWWMLREKKRPDVVALGLVLGGALGNILDRARLGYVVDFADLHFGEWRPFLVFNVADAAITIGVVILLLRALFVRDKAVPSADAPAPVENHFNA